jgi:hypothetical protein
MYNKAIFSTITSIIILLCIESNTYAQQKLVFNIPLGKFGTDLLVSRGSREARDIEAMNNYLTEDYKSVVVITEEQRNTVFKSTESYCNIINVTWDIGAFKSDLIAIGRYPMELKFQLCDGKIIEYNFPISVNGYTYDIKNAILRALRKNISKQDLLKKISTTKLVRNITTINKDTLDYYINGITGENISIVGVYKLISSTNFTSLDEIAILRIDNRFKIINLENSTFKKDWERGEVIGFIDSTTSSKYFIGKYKGLDMKEINVSLMYNENIIELTFTDTKEKRNFVKIK